MSSWTLDCPELEIRHTPLKGNHFAPNPGIETSIDLLEIHSSSVQSLEDPDVVYKRNLGHEELVEHLDPVRGMNYRVLGLEKVVLKLRQGRPQSPGQLEAAVTHLVRTFTPSAYTFIDVDSNGDLG